MEQFTNEKHVSGARAASLYKGGVIYELGYS